MPATNIKKFTTPRPLEPLPCPHCQANLRGIAAITGQGWVSQNTYEGSYSDEWTDVEGGLSLTHARSIGHYSNSSQPIVRNPTCTACGGDLSCLL